MKIKDKLLKKHKEEFPEHEVINEFYTTTSLLDKWNAEHPDEMHSNYLKRLANENDPEHKHLMIVRKTFQEQLKEMGTSASNQ